MRNYDYIFYLFLTSFLFITYFIITTIFGILFFNLILYISKKEPIRHSFWEKIFISFGLGLTIHIALTYLIAAFLPINFFTILLPIIIIDLMFILYRIYRRQKTNEKFVIWQEILNNDKLVFIIIIISLCFIQFIFMWNIVTYSLSYIQTDPFLWVGEISYVMDTGNFLIKYTEFYPDGYIVLCVSCLSVFLSPHFSLIYFFIKFAPIIFYFLLIFIFGSFIKQTFKKNYIVLISLVLLISTSYLNYRFLGFLPSNVATLLFTISLFTFIRNYPLYINGILFIGVFFINPLYSLHCFIIFFIYLNKRIIFSKKEIRRSILNQILKIIFIAIILICPYFFYLLSNAFNPFSIIPYYLKQIGLISVLGNTYYLGSNSLIFVILNLGDFLREILSYWIPMYPYPHLKTFYMNNTLIFSFFFIFAFISVFIRRKSIPIKNNNNLILYGKIAVILVIIYFIVPIILPYYFIFQQLPFDTILRVLEIYAPLIIFMECYAISFIVKKLSSLIEIIKNKNKYKDKSISNLPYIKPFFILLLVSSTLGTYYFNFYQKDYPYFYRYLNFRDDQIESIFFIKENIDPNSNILVSDFSDYKQFDNVLYRLLNNYNYFIWNFSVRNSYFITKNYSIHNNIEYILLDYATINSTELVLFISDISNFTRIYENNRNILLKLNLNN